MSTSIDVFRGPDRVPYANVPLIELLDVSVRRPLGPRAETALVRVYLHRVPDDDPPPTDPIVANLLPQYGYATVEVTLGDRVVYRHPHTTAELIGQPLREYLLAREPSEKVWGYAFSGLEIPSDEVTIPTPEVQGTVAVSPFAAGEKPAFRIKPLPPPAPPKARLADFGVTAPATHAGAAVKVLLADDLFRGIVARPFSAEVEEGGFLVGRVYEDTDTPGTHIVRLTEAPAARVTGASLLHFTFTGDSWEAVKQELRARQDPRAKENAEQLVGWYHTHLFAAAEEMGLSSIDVRLHFTTFLLPWQLAGLVNIDGDTRTLRFYTRRADSMVLCPQWVIDAGR